MRIFQKPSIHIFTRVTSISDLLLSRDGVAVCGLHPRVHHHPRAGHVRLWLPLRRRLCGRDHCSLADIIFILGEAYC